GGEGWGHGDRGGDAARGAGWVCRLRGESPLSLDSWPVVAARSRRICQHWLQDERPDELVIRQAFTATDRMLKAGCPALAGAEAAPTSAPQGQASTTTRSSRHRLRWRTAPARFPVRGALR